MYVKCKLIVQLNRQEQVKTTQQYTRKIKCDIEQKSVCKYCQKNKLLIVIMGNRTQFSSWNWDISDGTRKQRIIIILDHQKSLEYIYIYLFSFFSVDILFCSTSSFFVLVFSLFKSHFFSFFISNQMRNECLNLGIGIRWFGMLTPS